MKERNLVAGRQPRAAAHPRHARKYRGKVPAVFVRSTAAVADFVPPFEGSGNVSVVRRSQTADVQLERRSPLAPHGRLSDLSKVNGLSPENARSAFDWRTYADVPECFAPPNARVLARAESSVRPALGLRILLLVFLPSSRPPCEYP
jgi:hypothetical protein